MPQIWLHLRYLSPKILGNIVVFSYSGQFSENFNNSGKVHNWGENIIFFSIWTGVGFKQFYIWNVSM